ncbi:MAG: arylsulfatase [Blastopirellula sp.]|nr:MAG: arylsulfatase [Blastopirellula sp.]
MKNILVALCFVIFSAADLSAQEKPNIVYMLVDNWGWGDISVQGSTVETPRIDAFASQGLRFTNFNVQNQCTPTRSAIMTGRYPIRMGTQKVAAPGEPDGMAPWEYTIAELLSDSGYATALYGKWHVGSKVGRHPNDQGFDEWWGINEGSNAAAYTSTPQFDPTVAEVPHFWAGVKGKPSQKTEIYDIPAKATMDSRSTAKAIDFINARSEEKKPFFVYLGFTHFHPPWGVHSDFAGKSKAGIYSDTKLEVDYNVGQVLDAINAAGIADNTIVILTGDNGAANYPSPGIVTGEVGGSNGPWRGGLSTAWEGGMRTPAMIRWPRRIAASKVTDEIMADLDWFPTIAHLIGEQKRIPTDRPIDGINQASFLLGSQEKSAREHVVTYVGDTVFAVKWRNMKVHFATAEGTHSYIRKYTFPQVFDIKEDPKESFELWGNEGYAHAWVMSPVSKILSDLQKSMKKYPNILPGQDFDGYR